MGYTEGVQTHSGRGPGDEGAAQVPDRKPHKASLTTKHPMKNRRDPGSNGCVRGLRQGGGLRPGTRLGALQAAKGCGQAEGTASP